MDRDTLPRNFGQMIDAIEQHSSFGDKVMSGIKSEGWRAMHGYTHGGMHQIARRIEAGSIEPNYELEEII